LERGGMKDMRPTEKQTAARKRNWGIRGLRALYAQAGRLSAPRAAAVRAIIDDELASLGAERESVREQARITEDMIPF
jgi:hypothetical protein